MVTIAGYKEHYNDKGVSFLVLVLNGGIELVKSKIKGGYYATIRKATIPSTFDERTCKSLIGNELAGNVVKVDTTPYNYTIKETGEVIELKHKWVYTPEEDTADPKKSSSIIDDFIDIKNEEEVFSTNGAE